MMIGDSEVDAATGIAASSISVIVRGGYCHKPYEELNVTHLLGSMEELLDIIDNQYAR
jgi:phosphoglycolate phosphatase-like HAD superfamily hydrolase